MARKPFATESLTIVLPARDVEGVLERTFLETRAHASELVGRLEMVVVDDGSRDSTGRIAERLAAEHPGTTVLHHRRPIGAGQAILGAARRARTSLVMYLPAQGHFNLPDMANFLDASRRAQVVVGVRPPRADRPFLGRLASTVFKSLAGALLGEKFEDIAWVHLWRREVFDGLEARSRGLFFLVEADARALRRGMRAAQVTSAAVGSPSLRWRDALLALAELLTSWRALKRLELEGPPERLAHFEDYLRDFWWPRSRRTAPFGRPAPCEADAVPPRMERVEVAPALRPPWLDTALPMLIPVGAATEAPPAGAEVLAQIADGRPLVVRHESRIRFLFDAERSARWRVAEAYLPPDRPLGSRLPSLPPDALPGPIVLGAQSIVASLRSPPTGAACWPIDPSIEWLRWAIYQSAGSLGEDRAPIPIWPDGKRWALAVTHETDGSLGMSRAAAISSVDIAHGVRAAWFVPGEAMRESRAVAAALLEAGHELGLRSDRLDSSLPYLPAAEIERRLAACEDVVASLGVRGYRSPGLRMTPALAAVVGRMFVYDSSVPDTGLYGLTGRLRGCGTIFPFVRADGAVELPPTIPSEHELAVLGLTPREALGYWRQKVEFIRRVGGLALLRTHAEPHLGGAEDFLHVYSEFLAELTKEQDVWLATPCAIADWWARRALPSYTRAGKQRLLAAGSSRQ